MIQITGLDLSHLNNGAHYVYMRRILNRALADTGVMATCPQIVQNLQTAFKAEDEALKISQKSSLTDEIANADRDRDSLYSAYKNMVESMLVLTDTDMAKAAKELAQNIKDYGINTKMQLDKETGLIENMIQDLEGKLAPHVATLNLGPFVQKLKDANNLVEELITQRSDDNKEKVTGQLKKSRAVCDNYYRQMVDAVNAMVMMKELAPHLLKDTTTDLADFINFVNTEIVRYKREVLGKNATSNTPAEGGGDDTGGETPGDGTGGETPGTGETPGGETPGGGTGETPGGGTGETPGGDPGTGGDTGDDFV